MDRLEILKERVLNTVDEYKTLLLTLEKSFKNNNTDSVELILVRERELSKTLAQRVKIYNSYIDDLKKNMTIPNPDCDVYNSLNSLYSEMDRLKKKFTGDKVNLEREIFNVKKIVRPLGKLREETARRIDIIT